MSLPACNPIDYEWLARGFPIDHVGTLNYSCKICDASTPHEKFLILSGKYVGFGAPFFVKPFQKHCSTKGKVGGIRGHVVQCTQCNSLWAFDQEGVEALAAVGLGPELIAVERANEYGKWLAKQVEKDEVDGASRVQQPTRPNPSGGSRHPKPPRG
jgi:hypothetical protein